MRLVEIKTRKEKRRFIQFIYQIYEKDLCFKDTLISIVHTFLNRTDTFTKESHIRPITVVDKTGTLAQCMLIYNKHLSSLQIGFFDALPKVEMAVEMIIKEAIQEAKSLNLNKIIIGLNGHVIYGVGILVDNFTKAIPFDSLYNKGYYYKYFEKYNFNQQTLTTYGFSLNKMEFSPRVLQRIKDNYTYRYLDRTKFKEEMILFGKLCNETLKDTPYYFPRQPICMYELLKDLKPFLRPENLIFALKDGTEIGFVFWHPDFNEIIPGGKKNHLLGIGLRLIFKKRQIKTIVINAIGVLESFQRTTVVYGLLNEVVKVTKAYTSGVSNFVFDNNLNSTLFNKANTEKAERHYLLYEINL